MREAQQSSDGRAPAPWVALVFAVLGFAFVLAAVGAVVYGRKARRQQPNSAAAQTAVVLGWAGVAWNGVGFAVLAWRLVGA